jgi:hypothetical protein
VPNRDVPGPTPAADLKTTLLGGTAYTRDLEAVAAERQRYWDELTLAEQPIVDDLREAGYDVKSVWDLGNDGSKSSYPNALPILLSHLQRGGYPDAVMESLARALAVKEAADMWPALHELFLSAKGPREEEGLAVALAASVTRDRIEALIALLDKSDSEFRLHFLRPIKRLGGERGVAILESLRSDPELRVQAEKLLKGRKR